MLINHWPKHQKFDRCLMSKPLIIILNYCRLCWIHFTLIILTESENNLLNGVTGSNIILPTPKAKKVVRGPR